MLRDQTFPKKKYGASQNMDSFSTVSNQYLLPPNSWLQFFCRKGVLFKFIFPHFKILDFSNTGCSYLTRLSSSTDFCLIQSNLDDFCTLLLHSAVFSPHKVFPLILFFCSLRKQFQRKTPCSKALLCHDISAIEEPSLLTVSAPIKRHSR